MKEKHNLQNIHLELTDLKTDAYQWEMGRLKGKTPCLYLLGVPVEGEK